MDSKKKLWIIPMVGFIVIAVGMLMYAVIGLTGGGTALAGWKLILLSLAVAPVCGVGIAYCAIRAGLLQKKGQISPDAKAEKKWKTRGTVLVIVSAALVLAGDLLGASIRRANPDVYRGAWETVLGVLLLLTVGKMAVSLLMKWRMEKRTGEMMIREREEYWLAQRDEAEKTAAKKLRLLRLMRWERVFGAALLVGMGVLLSVIVSLSLKPGLVVMLDFWTFTLILAGLSQIRFSTEKETLASLQGVLSEADFPGLYALARRASAEVGCREEILLAVSGGASAGVGVVNGTVVVFLGVFMLAVFGEEELYAMLLHEFSHYSPANRDIHREEAYANWLEQDRRNHILQTIANFLFFSYATDRYLWESGLLRYSASLILEQRADEAMRGHALAAASGLMKLQCYDLHMWESFGREGNDYSQEEMADDFLSVRLTRYAQAIAERWTDWKEKIRVEIIARHASHPTVAMRVQALGFDELPDLLPGPEGAYGEEARRAVEYFESLVVRRHRPEYIEVRKEQYLRHLERVTAWEAEGKPLVEEKYGDILESLLQIDRAGAALELCERAIASLPPYAAAQGLFTRGLLRLHSWDAAGLDDVYAAMNENQNCLAEGLDAIGQFCCLTGRQEELLAYREKATELRQKDKDEYSQSSFIKRGDRLSQEHLPEGMLEGILAFIASIPDNHVENVYLVRKTISENFFTSAVILDFDIEAEDELIENVYHQVFRYLDTVSDWQFSLFVRSEAPMKQIEKIPGTHVFSRAPKK